MSIEFALSEDLEFFLPKNSHGKPFILPFRTRQTYKHLVESLGIPHTEIGCLCANGRVVSLDEISRAGDRVKVSSRKESPGEGEESIDSFVLDNHLGKLTRFLRFLGFDCFYDQNYQDWQLASLSSIDKRALLTRDRQLLMRSQVKIGYCLRSMDIIDQVGEVYERFCLWDHTQTQGRCVDCNTILREVDKSQIWHKLERLTILYFDEFQYCDHCGKIYWKGSHFERMRTILAPFIR